MKIVALLSTFNEADIIGETLTHLAGQGVDVHVFDDGSSDGTVAVVESFLGRGVTGIDRRADPARPGVTAWRDILRRKETLAAALDADWFIHHDADEFRESPWPGLTLHDALEHVSRLGYNAVDFLVLNFRPTDDGFESGMGVRDAFPFYEAASPVDRVQIKAWRKQDAPVDLVSSGGHEAQFENRRVCPIRFLLRHYPIRGQAHGERKVFAERRDRFDESERALGWHRQYDDYQPGHRFLWDASRLTRYDENAVKAALATDARADGIVVALEQALERERALLVESRTRVAGLSADLDRMTSSLEQWAARHASETMRLRDDLHALHASLSWRLTAPLRAVLGRITRTTPQAAPSEPRLRDLVPVSRQWGLDRGQPVDRYYIERFLDRHRADIKGRVLEVKDPGYTRAYGGAAVTDSQVIDIDRSNTKATLVADLVDAGRLPRDGFDCFILTQTLHIIYDLRGGLEGAARMLTPGGVLLCTVPAVSRVSDEDGGLESGDYWRLTQAAVRRLFGEVFGPAQAEVQTYGNVRACTAFLYGLASAELSQEELDFVDPWFPLIHCVRAVKPNPR